MVGNTYLPIYINKCQHRQGRTFVSTYTGTIDREHNSTATYSTHKDHYMHMDVDHILVDSGAATHVCPKDYATQFPLEPLEASTPQLFTATDDPVQVYGIRRVYYQCQGQRVVIPYFACDVKYPIISVSRLIDR